MKIALFEPINTFKKGALNKDLAGGLGTYSDYGGSVSAKLLTFIKNGMSHGQICMSLNHISDFINHVH